jgi:hypothetical protein
MLKSRRRARYSRLDGLSSVMAVVEGVDWGGCSDQAGCRQCGACEGMILAEIFERVDVWFHDAWTTFLLKAFVGYVCLDSVQWGTVCLLSVCMHACVGDHE